MNHFIFIGLLSLIYGSRVPDFVGSWTNHTNSLPYRYLLHLVWVQFKKNI